VLFQQVQLASGFPYLGSARVSLANDRQSSSDERIMRLNVHAGVERHWVPFAPSCLGQLHRCGPFREMQIFRGVGEAASANLRDMA
jgi:hypothetical protein